MCEIEKYLQELSKKILEEGHKEWEEENVQRASHLIVAGILLESAAEEIEKVMNDDILHPSEKRQAVLDSLDETEEEELERLRLLAEQDKLDKCSPENYPICTVDIPEEAKMSKEEVDEINKRCNDKREKLILEQLANPNPELENLGRAHGWTPNFQELGRKLLMVDELPQGGLARYEKDITAVAHVIKKGEDISKKTLEMIDKSAKNYKVGNVGDPIDLDRHLTDFICPECGDTMTLIWGGEDVDEYECYNCE